MEQFFGFVFSEREDYFSHVLDKCVDAAGCVKDNLIKGFEANFLSWDEGVTTPSDTNLWQSLNVVSCFASNAESLRHATHGFLNVVQQRLANATRRKQQKKPERHVKQTRMDHPTPVDPDTAGNKTKLPNLRGDAQKQHSESHRSTFASRCQC